MKTKYDIFTKDKEKMSYRAFIQAKLIELGLSPTSKGTFYLRDIITLAIEVTHKSWTSVYAVLG